MPTPSTRLTALARWRSSPAIIGIAAFIAFLHVAGWGTLIAIVVPKQLSVGATAFGIGLGITAYMLGVRHAFDADHIAAIDNTTRKLMQQGERPVSVGFWFSCGHATVVFILTLLLAVGVQALTKPLSDENSSLHLIAGTFGTIVSSGFLLAIALVNLAVFANILSMIRGMRAGGLDEAALERQLDGRGLISRVIGRTAGFVSRPWQMYVVGLLFGLGFDTATEIGLLVLATTSAASGLPWYAVLCLPVLFAAGMSLFDTLQGSFMTLAYGWALAQPVRKIYYNLVVTGLSVAVALLIGGVEIAALLGERFDLHGPVWAWIAGIDLNTAGFLIAGLFAVSWLAAVAIWKFGKFEERWSSNFERASAGE